MRDRSAEYVNGKWQNWRYVGDRLTFDYEVGELHISADGNELYFHSGREGGKGNLDIWVFRNVDGEWQEPELVISRSAGGPTLDNEGNIYFTHHFYNEGEMIEADIYVAYRKSPP